MYDRMDNPALVLSGSFQSTYPIWHGFSRHFWQGPEQEDFSKLLFEKG